MSPPPDSPEWRVPLRPGKLSSHFEFEFGGAASAEFGVPSFGVVPGFDPIHHGHFHRLAVVQDPSGDRRGHLISPVENRCLGLVNLGAAGTPPNELSMNEISYRLAAPNDVQSVWEIYAAAIAALRSSGVDQWDDIYPSRETIKDDIQNEQLTIGMLNGKIAVAFVLNRECDAQYSNGVWKHKSQFKVVHRLCVNPEFQNRGCAKHAMRHVEFVCKSDFTKSIRLDTFAENEISTAMYLKLGYEVVGTAKWRKGIFLLMEKEP